jgi:hypothetical protein
MSKRRSKSSPNLPPEVIERARRQLAEQSGQAAPSASASEPKTAEPPKPQAAAPKAAPRGVVAVRHAAVPAASAPVRIRRTTPRSAPSTARTGGRQPDQLDSAYLRERLANPTRIVTEAELHAEYGYVIKDLRSMALLAAGLIVALVILGNIIR